MTAVAGTTVDTVTVRHLTDLEPLDSGLLSARSDGGSDGSPPVPARRGRAGRLVGALVLAAIVAMAIDVLADATQSRPSPVEPGTSTTVELVVEQRRAGSALHAAEALTVACQGTLRVGAEVTRVGALAGDRVEIVVEPGLTELRRRRLFGCLVDTTLDLVQAHVVAWHTTTGPR